MARSADLCLSPYEGLVQKLGRHYSQVECLLHAHDFSLSDEPSMTGAAAAEEGIGTECADMIQVCYMGFIHYRICDATFKAVLQQPDMTLHLVGPVAPDYDRTVFAGFSNIVWHGSVTGDRLAELLRTMDVLIIPYDSSIPEVAVLTSTSKLFQYIAAGKPIVPSSLPCFLRMPKEVLISAPDPGEFVKRIREAKISDDDYARRIRCRIAMENTWNGRGVQLCSIIKSALGIDLEPSDGFKAG